MIYVGVCIFNCLNGWVTLFYFMWSVQVLQTMDIIIAIDYYYCCSRLTTSRNMCFKQINWSDAKAFVCGYKSFNASGVRCFIESHLIRWRRIVHELHFVITTVHNADNTVAFCWRKLQKLCFGGTAKFCYFCKIK